MKDFKEFQFGWLIFVCLIPVQVLIAYLSVNKLGDRPIDSTGFILINLVLILPYFLFYGMTTRVSKDLIIVSFGIGLIRKRISLSRITEVERVLALGIADGAFDSFQTECSIILTVRMV